MRWNLAMDKNTEPRADGDSDLAFAIVLRGVSEKWQKNLLQVRGCPTTARVEIDGYGLVEAPAILLTQDQARHLATQIIEILGSENADTHAIFLTAYH